MDTATQSNYAVISSEHIHLAWKIEWDAQLVTGTVTHSMIAHASTNEVVFDTSFLTINSIHVQGGSALHYALGERHDVMGSALNVKLGRVLEKGDGIEIIIDYSTTKDCTALGWLTSGEYPFLYSQCQAIHARSLVRESFGSNCYAQSLTLFNYFSDRGYSSNQVIVLGRSQVDVAYSYVRTKNQSSSNRPREDRSICRNHCKPSRSTDSYKLTEYPFPIVRLRPTGQNSIILDRHSRRRFSFRSQS
jgi:hypothetical protein